VLLGWSEPFHVVQTLRVSDTSTIGLAFSPASKLRPGREFVEVYSRPRCLKQDLVGRYEATAELPTPSKPLYLSGSSCTVVYQATAREVRGVECMAFPADDIDPWLPYLQLPRHRIIDRCGYPHEMQEIEKVSIEGASALAVLFHPQTWTQKEHVISFYVTPDLSSQIGDDYSGPVGDRNFPGIEGNDVLIVPADTLYIRFRVTTAAGITDSSCGYKILVVDADAVLNDYVSDDDDDEAPPIPPEIPFSFPFLDNKTAWPQTVLVDMPVRKGRAYFEVYLEQDSSPTSFVQIGWCFPEARLLPNMDAANISTALTLGGSPDVFCVDGVSRREQREALKYSAKGPRPYTATTWKAGSVVGCYLDHEDGTISYFCDGQPLGVAFNRRDFNLSKWSRGLVPVVALSPGQALTINTGLFPFMHAEVLQSSSLPQQSVADAYSRRRGQGRMLVWDPFFSTWAPPTSVDGVWQDDPSGAVLSFCHASYDVADRVSPLLPLQTARTVLQAMAMQDKVTELFSIYKRSRPRPRVQAGVPRPGSLMARVPAIVAALHWQALSLVASADEQKDIQLQNLTSSFESLSKYAEEIYFSYELRELVGWVGALVPFTWNSP
jgi:hypothetical protein